MRSDNLNWALEVDFSKDLHLAIEELSHNLTISLLSISNLKVAMETRRTYVYLAYQYSQSTLLITYLAAGSATFVSLLIGLHALWSNGIASDVSFSRVLVTTRNPTLDRLSESSCLGGDPFPRSLLKTRLKFGELWRKNNAGIEVPHAGFGTEEEVMPLRKGEKYL